MNNSESRLLLLLEKFKNGIATAEELEELDSWYDSFDLERKLSDELSSTELNLVHDRMLATINSEIPKSPTKRKPVRRRPIFKFITVGLALVPLILFFLREHSSIEDAHTTRVDAAPGKNTARLILPTGSIIDLEKAKRGPIYKQPDLVITKDSIGQISYHFNKLITNKQIQGDNSLIIPSGGQYRVILSDGTKVWLNAKSEITFPAEFVGNSRNVKLSGEAYFEVAKNKVKPFFVHTPQQEIKVLGTHFNVNAYADEKIQKTTLLEGLVQIKTTDKIAKTVIIQPGQQAQQDDQMIQVRTANSEAAVGWTNGVFVFDHTDIQELMRQLARWYDVEVIYQGPIKPRNFSGEIERDYTLKEVLRILELGNVHFKIEEPKIKGGQKRLIIN
ncbi:FecR family protein [Mucilaginibacter endophyticus]|uniref:FecR family protein n=1 Tax=Mucilaginibacter endophyticus TaxID=2675003 RepID=UPI000E0CFE62|nr:FecR family protein [Mucilaginibacter endophyticus]